MGEEGQELKKVNNYKTVSAREEEQIVQVAKKAAANPIWEAVKYLEIHLMSHQIWVLKTNRNCKNEIKESSLFKQPQ